MAKKSIIEEIHAVGDLLLGVTIEDAAKVSAASEHLLWLEKKMKKNARDRIRHDLLKDKEK